MTMENPRARIYAVCAVKLDEDYADAAEGTFDAALTNALVAIVAHEWPGQERTKPGKTRLRSASELLTLITEKAEAGDRAKLAPGQPGVCLIPDPVTDGEPPADVGEESSLFSQGTPLPPLDTRIDVATLMDALEATQPIRHGREEEGRPLERRHVDALLDLDSHTSLMALAAEQEDRYERGASEEDQRERARALERLELLGQDAASRRAAEAAEIHEGYHPKHNPEGLDLQDCPVCDYTAFSAVCGDDLGMQIGIGQCLSATTSEVPRPPKRKRKRDWHATKPTGPTTDLLQCAAYLIDKCAGAGDSDCSKDALDASMGPVNLGMTLITDEKNAKG